MPKNEEKLKSLTWALTDHLCKKCGGRILRCVSEYGITAGGNPLWKCASCGKSIAEMGPESLCWCGFTHKHNYDTPPYVCQPFAILNTRPELLEAFRACGCDPTCGGEIGVMLERDFNNGH